jgi:hypothetical protein
MLYYLLALVSAVASGAIFALVARIAGVEQAVVLLAIAVIGGGLQLIFLIAWFLHHARPDKEIPASDEKLANIE